MHKEAQRNLPTWAYPGAGYVRKEPCNFGWDWGPTLITCGIWRNIGLVAFDTARLEDVAIVQDHSQPGKVTLSDRSDGRTGRRQRATARPGPSVSARGTGNPAAAAVLQDGRARSRFPIAHPQALVAGRHGRRSRCMTSQVELLGRRGQGA